MAQHQQIGGAPPNIPLVPSTDATSPLSSPPAPLNTPLTFSTSISPRSSNRRQEEHFATLHTVIFSLITTVGGYLLFQFQSMKLSLFDEHGNIMRAAFVMLFFYVVAFMAEFRLQNESNDYFAIMKQFTPLFRLLVVILLLFILSFFLGLAAPIIWAFLVVGPMLKLFEQIIQSLCGIIQYITTNQTTTSNLDIQYITTDQTATSNPDVEERDPLEIL
ncbi:hypothetical protein K1719_018079 [Acacia pycnantha]|nr:hypothetical protein K1719_018056 [Acacia pycnantha]KAI9110959.1 hypothetical protein K1719_018079 [Acacia pycnantha]